MAVVLDYRSADLLPEYGGGTDFRCFKQKVAEGLSGCFGKITAYRNSLSAFQNKIHAVKIFRIFQVDEYAPAAEEKTSVCQVCGKFTEGLACYGFLSVGSVNINLMPVVFRVQNLPEPQTDGAARRVYFDVSVGDGKTLYDFVKQRSQLSVRIWLYQIVKSADTETVQGMIRGCGQEDKNTVRIKQAQFFCRIHSILLFQINIQKYQTKPFLPGGQKKGRAGVERRNFSLQRKAGKLAVQSVF